MKPAVLRPCARSRSRCSIGNRTSACVPDKNMRFASSRYLSSSPTSINAIAYSPSACALSVSCRLFEPVSFGNRLHRFCYACTAQFHGCRAYLARALSADGPCRNRASLKRCRQRERPRDRRRMTSAAFNTETTERDSLLFGPWRRPAQMLHAQVYDSHASIHDDATAQKLGFQGGTIEGPTHFSQFAPLCEKIWGKAWFETGCLSAHYRNPAFEGEEVQATIATPKPGEKSCTIGMTRRDGTEILRGTASVGQDGTETALHQRLGELKPLADPVILGDLNVGMKTGRQIVKMDFDQNMGDLYPFSLREKLKVITEPSPYYSGSDNPWGRPIVPMEMLSVLFQYRAREDRLPVRGPAVGLFADRKS